MRNDLETITQAEARELSMLGMEAVDFLKCCYRAIRTAAEKGRGSVKVPAEVHWIHDMEFESELHGVIQRLRRENFQSRKWTTRAAQSPAWKLRGDKMKLFQVSKDGGPDSTVTAFWLVEIKSLFSVCLLRFGPGSRDEFHSHAFNSVGWLLKGLIQEQFLFPEAGAHRGSDTVPGTYARYHKPSLKPIVVKRSTFHRVFSFGTSWVLNVRGPWAKDWLEWSPAKQEYSRLTNGRKVEERWK